MNGCHWLGTHSLARKAAARVGEREGRGPQNIKYSNLWMKNHPEGSHGLGRDSKPSQKGTLFGLSYRVTFMRTGEVIARRV